MKITTQSKEKPEKKITYPAHFKNNQDNSIVLALTSDAGVVVERGNGTEEVGEFGSAWKEFSDRNVWTPVQHKTTFED